MPFISYLVRNFMGQKVTVIRVKTATFIISPDMKE